jgi:hypothetical protein
MELKPIEGHSCYIEHKIINGQPFLELTVFNKENSHGSGHAVDQCTFRPTENETLFRIVRDWMYSGESI